MDNNLAKRYQTLIILWFAMLMNIGVFFLISVFAGPKPENGPVNSLLTFVLAAVGTFMVVLSFAVKRKLLQRSVDNQDVSLVSKALIIACAMCEIAAMLALIERFVIRNNDYYLLFIVAVLGTALHFPRREQLDAASYKTLSSGQDA